MLLYLGPNDDESEKAPTIPESERQELRQEFITIMQEKFLSGKDKNFDYRYVFKSTTFSGKIRIYG